MIIPATLIKVLISEFSPMIPYMSQPKTYSFFTSTTFVKVESKTNTSS